LRLACENYFALPRAAVYEGPGVPRIVEHPEGATVRQRGEHDLARAAPGVEPARPENRFLGEVAHDFLRGAGPAKGLEEQTDRILDLGIGVQRRCPVRSITKPIGGAHPQLPPPGLVELSPEQPGAQHVQLGFTHRALEAQEQANR
jgi:hypothetical protein